MELLKPKNKKEFIEIQEGRHTSNTYEFSLSPWHEDVFKEFKQYLKSPVLDIGTRNGLLLDKLEKKGYEAWGIEITDIAKWAQFKKRKVIQEDIQEKTIFPDKFFKSAIMTHSLEHLYKTNEALKEIKRILNGYILITVPLGKADARFGHFTMFENIDELIKLVKDNGFEIIKSYDKGIYCQTVIAKV